MRMPSVRHSLVLGSQFRQIVAVRLGRSLCIATFQDEERHREVQSSLFGKVGSHEPMSSTSMRSCEFTGEARFANFVRVFR